MASVVGWGLVLWLLQGLWAALTGLQGVPLEKALQYSWSAMMENSSKNPSVNTSGQVRIDSFPKTRHAILDIFFLENIYRVCLPPQMLVGWWLTFCLVISTGFRSSLISHLTVQSRTRAPENFGDLVAEEGWNWGTETWTYDGAVLEYFSKHTHPVMKQIHNNMQVS